MTAVANMLPIGGFHQPMKINATFLAVFPQPMIPSLPMGSNGSAGRARKRKGWPYL